MRMTIVPEDKMISVNGEALTFDFAVPPGVHAIQVYNTYAEIEYADGRPNETVKSGDLMEFVSPFVGAYSAELTKREARRQAEEQARLEYESSDEYRHAQAISGLYENTKRFIEYQPDGRVRYDADLKLNIMAAMMLAQNQGQPVPQMCLVFQQWVGRVQDEFLALKAQIEGGELDVNVSYEMFENKFGRFGTILQDPHITTSMLKNEGLL